MKVAQNGIINVFIKLDGRTNFRGEMFLQRQIELCNKIRQLQNVQRIYVWRHTPVGGLHPHVGNLQTEKWVKPLRRLSAWPVVHCGYRDWRAWSFSLSVGGQDQGDGLLGRESLVTNNLILHPPVPCTCYFILPHECAFVFNIKLARFC